MRFKYPKPLYDPSSFSLIVSLLLKEHSFNFNLINEIKFDPPGMGRCLVIIQGYFLSIFHKKTQVVGTHKKSPGEKLLMSKQNYLLTIAKYNYFPYTIL